MFDIGWTEILIIAVVAIIVVGPKDLPRMLRSLGRYAGQLRRTASEFRAQFDEAIHDSELDELRSSLQEVTDLNPMNQIRDSVTESMAPLKQSADSIKSGIEATESASKKPAPAQSKTKSKTKTTARTRTAKSGG